MDLFTQGVLGVALAQTAPRQADHLRIATGFGLLAGMAPDIDALIRSPTDPLMFLIYHRHFTHALAFVPVGAAVCAGALHLICGRRWGVPFRRTFLYCLLGYATHGVLDAATTYGTMLLWPFSEARIAWSLVSIIDPLFTLPLAGLIAATWLRRRRVFAAAALAWAGLYMSAAYAQHGTALDAARQIAMERGHTPSRVEVKPSFGNIIVWKTIYETVEGFHTDAVRVGVSPRRFEGVTTPKLDVAARLPWLMTETQQARDIERFRRFSDGYVALDPRHAGRIIDLRYSFVPNDVDALWSIEVSPEAAPDEHARYLTHRNNARENLGRLWAMIAGG
jgi:inner membrane protein